MLRKTSNPAVVKVTPGAVQRILGPNPRDICLKNLEVEEEEVEEAAVTLLASIVAWFGSRRRGRRIYVVCCCGSGWGRDDFTIVLVPIEVVAVAVVVK